MSGKGDKHREHAIHGDGLDSIGRGFDELGMPDGRRVEALAMIAENEVHIAKVTPRPSRTLTWNKQVGEYVGWLLPGAESGSGGGSKHTTTPKVLCPDSFLWHPAGTMCEHCEIVHPT